MRSQAIMIMRVNVKSGRIIWSKGRRLDVSGIFGASSDCTSPFSFELRVAVIMWAINWLWRRWNFFIGKNHVVPAKVDTFLFFGSGIPILWTPHLKCTHTDPPFYAFDTTFFLIFAMSNPFISSSGTPSRSKTIVRQKYIPAEQDYYDPTEDVEGDFSEFEGWSFFAQIKQIKREPTWYI